MDRLVVKRDLRSGDKLKAIQVHTNGTCTLRLSPNQVQRFNVRRLQPFRESGSRGTR